MTQQAKIQTDRPSGGVPRQMGEISLSRFFYILCDRDFLPSPETKPENRFLHGLIHRMSMPGY